MSTKTIAKAVAAAFLAIALALTVAACNSSSKGSVKGAAASAAANPTVSTELNQAEQALLGNIQEHFNAVHPVKSVEAGIRATYPNGSTSKIVNFAAKNFTLAVVHPLQGANPARDAWLLKVTNYAQSLGAAPAASPGVGTSTAQPAIPGTTVPASLSAS